jgi:hypothetical protein
MASPFTRVLGSRPFTTTPSSCCVWLYQRVESVDNVSACPKVAVLVIAAAMSAANLKLLFIFFYSLLIILLALFLLCKIKTAFRCQQISGIFCMVL